MTEFGSATDRPSGEGGAWGDSNDTLVYGAQDLLEVLAKAFRAYQLYDANNPVRQRFLESLRKAFEVIWAEDDALTLAVDEECFFLADREVYKGESRGSSLAFLFFKDGIREITFLPGIEVHELERFLGVLQRARKLLPEGDDLLTVLWEEELQYFRYRYVDFLAEGVGLPTPGEGNSRQDFQNVLDSELGEGGEEPAPQEGQDEEEGGEETAEGAGPAGRAETPLPQTVKKDDFNPTLYSLDRRELEVLKAELDKELRRDLRSDVLSALFDRLEEPRRPERQSEILGILGTLLPNFLSRGELTAATRVLEEVRALEAIPGTFDEERLAMSRALLDEVSAPEAIGELIQSLYDGSMRATPQQLAAFLSFLRAEALSPLLRASETVDSKELQAVLRTAVKGIADRNRGSVVRLLGESDAVVASGAARLAGEMRITEAGPALAGLLGHPHASVRLAAVEAAVSLKASTAAGRLLDTLDDPEREVRIAAARALGALRYPPAAKRISEILGSKGMRAADISEKVAFFEAFGLVAGEGAVDTLDKFLNSKSFFGKREPSEIRAAAALALGRVSGSNASAALGKASEDDDPVVRSAVHRALRSEG